MQVCKFRLIEIAKGLLLGLLVVICSFPENEWTYSIGIDPPLAWAFNYLFEQGSILGKNIIFPHGPLAFLMYPLPPNIVPAIIISALLKITLIFNITGLISLKDKLNWVLVILLSLFISLVSNFNQLILANLLFLYCNYYNQEKYYIKLFAFILTAFAFYIRSYVAILSGMITLSFIVYYFANKKYWQSVIDGLAVLSLIILFWIILFGKFSGIIEYFIGVVNLAGDNSSAVSFYPYNNWWWISVFLIISFTLPWINKTKKSFFFAVLTSFSLFATWKHGMAREDFFHVRGLFIYALFLFLVSVLFERKHLFRNLIVALIAFIALFQNQKNIPNYQSYKFDWEKPANFIEFVSHFNTFKNNSQLKSLANIQSNKLPEQILDTIGTSTVDVYPWDYSFIPANHLNWQPRPVIQSYAAYTSWLDQKNADHFSSSKAPEYIIWDLDKITQDCNHSDYNSIDNRYLLNDEPRTIIKIIKNYELFSGSEKFLILKKREAPIESKYSILKNQQSAWNKWIKVPESEGSLTRLKLSFQKTIIQKIKSFLYKDEQFWIYMKLKDESIIKYRIVPKNAEDGLWINPYIHQAEQKGQIKAVMFINSTPSIVSKQIELDWESIHFDNENKVISDFFQLTNTMAKAILLDSENTFEFANPEYWGDLAKNSLSNNSFEGGSSHLCRADSYSATFRFPLDSLPFGDYQITLDCWGKSANYRYSRDISLVVAIDSTNNQILWKGNAIDEQLIDRKQWNHLSNQISYTHDQANCTLTAYAWNISNTDILIDNMRVRIKPKILAQPGTSMFSW